ncbi:MAG: hypothetical protein V5B78_03040 [Desulfohalobiaceae bacterium]
MQELTQKIRESAKRLLQEGQVDCVLGYRKGTVPMQERPFFAYTPQDADQLVWTRFCVSNLANFLIGRQDRVAVAAQGCVSRNIVGLIQEKQITREQVYVIGLHSPGMVDRGKVQALFPDRVIHSVEEDGEELIVNGADFSERIKVRDVKRDNCNTCIRRNAVIYDELIGEQGEESGGGNIDKVSAPWEKLSPEERWERFEETFKDCIRCYACRDVCPLCYCNQCFVDENQPQWCGKTVEETDVHTFHILRAFHCAGRCTDCGACESACPVGIKMRRLTSKLEMDIRELYDYSPGLDLESTPPLSVYRPDDPEPFASG